MRSHPEQIRHRHLPRRDARGFTLIELLITLTVLVVVMGTVSVIVYMSSKSKTASAQRIESVQGARAALDMLAGDLRSAGYGADLTYSTPQPPIAYIDSTQVLINADLGPFPETSPETVYGAPQAYSPTGSPRPFPLDGTAWQPPVKYRGGGAEVIRYTLDANNDGAVNSNDPASANGALAGRTPNPDDYVLLRQVYGDSTGALLGNNGGTTQQIALVKKPGGSVPPMFTVYMKGSTTPWDWSNGPVPASQLGNIERINVQVDAASGTRDSKGNYAETVLRTDINSMRNIPNFGGTQYAVSGYVFNDNGTLNGIKDGGEPGLSGVRVTLGSYSTATDANGYFLFRVFAGHYVLRHVVPVGYSVYTSPDSFALDVTSAMTRSFADRAIPGGHVNIHVYQDLNGNYLFDSGEPGVPNIPVRVMPDSSTGVTDASGNVSNLFARPGAFTATVTLPDSFIVVSTPYPVTGAMSNGGTASYDIGVKKSLTGTISGKVFNDNNRDGVWQTGEAGIQNVWVGVTNDGGSTILGFAYSNATGDYSISVPINDPPHTTPYSVFMIPPGGKFPTSSTSIGSLWIQTASTLAGKNFGVGAYNVISLTANRVLSLAAADVIEKDWNGNQTQNASGDTDLILGADAGATDNISVWFNQYNAATLFGATPSNSDGYTRLAPNSVMAIAVDTLDSDATWKRRPDIVTGTRVVAAGNFFVWINQNTSGNYGILPTSPSLSYKTNDQGDVQSVLTLDCAGGAMPDIIVGTKSPTANTGTIEVWQNSDAVSPTFTRQEIYPNAGSIPGNRLGEVNAMILADLDNDGRKDLIVGTKTGVSSGELVIFKNVNKNNGTRFVCVGDYTLTNDIATALGTVDLDGDGKLDIVVGTQASTSSGNLMIFRSVSTSGSSWAFSNLRTVAASGVVMSITTGDLGGGTRNDVAVGWRSNTSGYAGGISIYYTDVFGLPSMGTDPSAGSIASMVPALCTGNFNYGVNPPASAPFLTDFACGVKISASTGALVVFIR